jgi:hypothetical protein
MTTMWQKILLTLAILGLISSGSVACYGFNHIEESIRYFFATIDSNSPTAQIELKPGYPIELYFKDLYVWVGIWFDVTLFLLCAGCVTLALYLLLRILPIKKNTAAETNMKPN